MSTMNIKKIFVSKQAGIGDVILTTPVLASLKKQFPAAAITLMTFPNAVEAVRGLPFLDEVFSYDKKRDSVRKVMDKMRRADLALLLDLQYRPALLAFLARIPLRVGLAHKRRFWLTHPVAWDEAMDHTYEPHVMAGIAERAIGLSLPRTDLDELFFAEPSAADHAWVDQLLAVQGIEKGKSYLACSPVTAHYLKDWPMENWLQLFTRIYDEFALPAVIFGGAETIIEGRFSRFANVCGQTSLAQAACLVKRSKLLVGSCSLPVHMAAAWGIPSVALYGVTDFRRWAPRRNCTVITADLACSPCDGYRGTNCTDNRCMRQISVDEVYEACKTMLNR